MTSDAKFDEVNRATREYIERTRERLRAGRATLARLHDAIEDTNRHIESMASWIEENERMLHEERKRRSSSSSI
jgi:predicted  nucleic acid-binding Zn-ribbon protein